AGGGPGLLPPAAPDQPLRLAVALRRAANARPDHAAGLSPAPLERRRDDLLGRVGPERAGTGAVQERPLGRTPSTVSRCAASSLTGGAKAILPPVRLASNGGPHDPTGGQAIRYSKR